MKCSKCTRLLAAREKLKSNHATAVEALSTRRDTSNVREYFRLKNEADKARLDSEFAQSELQQHQWSHTRPV